LETLWTGDNIEESRKKDTWPSVIEAIDRDLSGLNNDYKFKRLIKIVETKYGDSKFDFNDLYSIGYKSTGPWLKIAAKVQEDLSSMDALKTKNTGLVDKQNNMML